MVSPDGTTAVYIRDNNLWLRQVQSGEVYQLTFDGVEDFGYATNNAGWIRDKTPVVKWSPDSKKIATFQHDGRKVQEMALWSTKIGHPEIDVWKYPLAGDENIFMIERVIIHVDNLSSPQTVRLNIPADPHRSSTSDHIAGSEGEFLDTQWSEDSSSLSFVSSSRDHKVAQLRTANIYTGEVKIGVFFMSAESSSGSASVLVGGIFTCIICLQARLSLRLRLVSGPCLDSKKLI